MEEKDASRFRGMALLALCALALFYACAGALNPWPYEWRSALVPLSNIREALVQYHVLRN